MFEDFRSKFDSSVANLQCVKMEKNHFHWLEKYFVKAICLKLILTIEWFSWQHCLTGIWFWNLRLKTSRESSFLPFFSHFQKSYGNVLGYNKSANNTLRLFYNSEDLDDFFKGFQAKYWEKHGAPFVKISAEKCREIVPSLGKLQMQ